MAGPATRPHPIARPRVAIAVVGVVAFAAVALGFAAAPQSSSPAPAAASSPVATFTVAGGETFMVELATPELLAHAQQLLAGENVSAIPLGTVVRGDAGVNAPWSWHIDPTTFGFAFVTIEVCDGLPSHVEEGVVTSPQYCPWSAKVTAIDNLPATTDPLPTPEPTTPAPDPAGLPALADPLSSADGAHVTGVAQVSVGDRCTGSLIDTGVPTGPAYVLTNGHCAAGRDVGPNTVVRNDRSTGDAVFGMFADALDRAVSIPVVGVPYSSMKGADVSVVRLDRTLAETRGEGLTSLRIADTPPAAGTSLTNVGIPVQGTDTWVLRRGSCTLGEPVDLLEFTWHFDHEWINDCPGIRGGSSGSPLLDADGQIVALINTTTAGADPHGGDCYLGKPCERHGAAPVVVPDRSYAVGVSGLGRCFDARGVFRLGVGCPLDPGGGVDARLDQRAVRPPAVGGPSTARIELTAPVGSTVEHKSGPADSMDCATADGYSAPAKATAELTIPVPSVEGMYVTCVADPRDRAHASLVVLQVDATGPQRPVTLSVRNFGDEIAFEPIYSIPELSHFRLKYGPPDATDCADPAGYFPYRRVPVEIPPAEQPAAVCVIGEDEAGNQAAPWRQILKLVR